MIRASVLSVVLMVAGVASRGAAGQRPDFSGTWIAGKDAPVGVAAAPSPVLGEKFELRHNGGSLTVIRPVGERTIKGRR